MFLPRSDQELVVWKSSSGGDTFLVAKVPLQESPIQFQSWQLPCSLSISGGSTVLPNQPYGHGTLAMVLAAQFPPGPSMFSNPTVLAFSVILRALLLRFRTQFQSVCMCVWGGGFPIHNTKQFTDTSDLTENSTQSWHDLSRDSTRFHRLKVQSCKTGSHPLLQTPVKSPRLLPVLLTDRLQTGRTTSSLCSFNLLEPLAAPGKQLYSPFLLKDMIKIWINSQMKRFIEWSMACHSPQSPKCSEVLGTQIFGLWWRPHYMVMTKSSATGWFNLQCPLPSSEMGGWGKLENSSPLITGLVLLATRTQKSPSLI